MTNAHALIFTGGNRPHSAAEHIYSPHSLVIAADSGFDNARRAGKTPHVLIGDMDSISPQHLAEAEASGIEVIRHPSDKDKTDTELALELAIERGKSFLTVISGGGDRLDHVLGFMHSAARFAGGDVFVDLLIGTAQIDIVAPEQWHTIVVGEQPIVSLIPLGGPARGVSTERLTWELDNDILLPFHSRGVSNVALDTSFNIHITDGVLAVVQPYFFDPDIDTVTPGGLN
ncbi:MAG: thiamine diphosphokinase [Ilumatobacteraceae bacterium]